MVRGAACPIWDDLTSMAVLRYSPYNKSVVDVIRSRTLGKPINIVHVEPVGYFHFAHSYVRGNWSREETSSFALLAKSCQYVVLHLSSLPLPSNRVYPQRYRYTVPLLLSSHTSKGVLFRLAVALPQVLQARERRIRTVLSRVPHRT